jgi:hypothetical protein
MYPQFMLLLLAQREEENKNMYPQFMLLLLAQREEENKICIHSSCSSFLHRGRKRIKYVSTVHAPPSCTEGGRE